MPAQQHFHKQNQNKREYSDNDGGSGHADDGDGSGDDSGDYGGDGSDDDGDDDAGGW